MYSLLISLFFSGINSHKDKNSTGNGHFFSHLFYYKAFVGQGGNNPSIICQLLRCFVSCQFIIKVNYHQYTLPQKKRHCMYNMRSTLEIVLSTPFINSHVVLAHTPTTWESLNESRT